MSTVLRGRVDRNAISPFAGIDQQYRAIFDAVNDGIVISNPVTGRFIEINQSGCQMFGYDKSEIVGREFEMLSSGIYPYTQDVALEKAKRAYSGQPQTFEWQCKTKAGDLFWAEVSLRFTEFGNTPAIVANVRDVGEAKRRTARITTAINYMSQGLCMFDADKKLIVCNEQYARMYGIPLEDVLPGTPFQQILRNRIDNGQFRVGDPEQYYRERMAAVEERVTSVKVHNMTDGRTIAISHRPMPGGGWVATHDDITDIRRIEAQVEHLAHYDELTGLRNRASFTNALNQSIEHTLHTGKAFAVLLLDLDHFKDVNDTRGHPLGDRLLRLVAERLQARVRVRENVFRLGGDEFAILVNNAPSQVKIATLAERLIGAVSRPFGIDGLDLHVGASIGVAICRNDNCDTHTLMSHADMALYRAKAEGRQSYRFYSAEMDEAVRSRVALTDELRVAIPGGQLFLTYQPQVTGENGRIVGVEALVRWNHPTRGILGPDSFLPVAESSGLIIALDRWVLREACRQGRQWIDAGIAPGTMCVNLSSAQFGQPLELEAYVMAVLAETGMPAHLLELEITESTLIGLMSEHREMIQRLRAAGIRFALDDFGTGYSSLNYLRLFTIDRIKIAQEFVADLTSNSDAAEIVKCILNLARVLGNEIIAEGVETPEQLRLLQEWSCPDIQGFYFAAPMTAEALSPLLTAGAIRGARQ